MSKKWQIRSLDDPRVIARQLQREEEMLPGERVIICADCKKEIEGDEIGRKILYKDLGRQEKIIKWLCYECYNLFKESVGEDYLDFKVIDSYCPEVDDFE